MTSAMRRSYGLGASQGLFFLEFGVLVFTIAFPTNNVCLSRVQATIWPSNGSPRTKRVIWSSHGGLFKKAPVRGPYGPLCSGSSSTSTNHVRGGFTNTIRGLVVASRALFGSPTTFLCSWVPEQSSWFLTNTLREATTSTRGCFTSHAACIFALQARVHPDRVHVFYFLHELSSVTVHNIYTVCVRLLCTVGVCHHHLVVAHTHCAEVTDICLSLPHTHVARVVTCVQVDALKPTCVVST